MASEQRRNNNSRTTKKRGENSAIFTLVFLEKNVCLRGGEPVSVCQLELRREFVKYPSHYFDKGVTLATVKLRH